MIFPRYFYFGKNSLLLNLPHLIKKKKGSLIIFVSKTVGYTSHFKKLIHAISFQSKIHVEVFSGEPRVEDVDYYVEKIRKIGVSVIVGIGGGSILDLTKAITLKTYDNFEDKKIFLVSVPTTAGSGSEVNNISILWDNAKKIALINDLIVPNLVILDPLLLVSLPKTERLFSMLDATSHAVESLFAKKGTFVSDMFAKNALSGIMVNHQRYLTSSDPEVINRLQLAACCAGISFGQAGTSIVHAFAYALVEQIKLSHGHSVSLVLSPVLKYLITGKYRGVKPIMENLQAIESAIMLADKYDRIIASTNGLELNQALLARAALSNSRLMNNCPVKLSKRGALEIANEIYEKINF